MLLWVCVVRLTISGEHGAARQWMLWFGRVWSINLQLLHLHTKWRLRLFPYGLHLSSPPVCFNILCCVKWITVSDIKCHAAESTSTTIVSGSGRGEFKRIRYSSKVCLRISALRAYFRSESFTRCRYSTEISNEPILKCVLCIDIIWPARRTD